MWGPLLITGDTASLLCLNALRHFIHGDWGAVSPRGLAVRERVNVCYHLRNASACVPWLRARRLNYGFMAAEFAWMWLGRSDVASITQFCPTIAQFSDDGLHFFGAYGPPLRRQLDYVVDALRNDRDTRQAVLVIWRENPPSTRDVPCTVACQFVRRSGALHGIFTMRSSDAWLGLPYDVFNFSRVTAAVAGQLGESVGSLTINVGSAHLYERDVARTDEVVRADEVRHLVAARLPPPAEHQLASLNAALSGSDLGWGGDDELTGWRELYGALRWARTREADRLAGVFRRVITGDDDGNE